MIWAASLLAAAAAAAPLRYITPEMDKALLEGVDDIYRMRFDDAERKAREVIAMNPEHPHAYLGLAGVTWTRYAYETDQGDDSLIAEFEKRTAEAVLVGNKWLKKHPDDAHAMMTVGAAYGLSSRLQ